MRQALHIFLKDVRGLRHHIVLLMALIACFVWLDVHVISNVVITAEVIVTAAVWFLIARAIHNDGLADDDEFWLTRPYERKSLLLAKLLMAIFSVAVPFFIADAAILATQSLPVANYFGGIALRQLYVSLWLIVPPFAIASVTRTAAQNVLAWIVMAAIALLTWFPGLLGTDNQFRLSNEKYALTAALALAIIAAWLQFSSRRTTLSRILIAAAILLPAPPFPESAALAIEQLRDSEPALTSRISVTAAAQDIAEPEETGYQGSRHCANIPLRMDGIPPGWQVAILSQNDRFESDGRTWSSGWRQGLSRPESLSVCAAGDRTSERVSVRTTIALAVYAPEKSIRVPATLNTFEVPGIGTCRFAVITQTQETRQYILACRTAVWVPPPGEVGIAGKASPAAAISPAEFPWTPFGLLPGLSPILRWGTLEMDEGVDSFDLKKGIMPRSGLKSLIREGGKIEFRPRKQVAILRREISVREIRFPN
ncbi:MAG TPA: ABC-2 transporter permease [Bryobacteraceae bacterium]|nr:ABC-2 transporter permease [Bryobacteraceae bacterium]